MRTKFLNDAGKKKDWRSDLACQDGLTELAPAVVQSLIRAWPSNVEPIKSAGWPSETGSKYSVVENAVLVP